MKLSWLLDHDAAAAAAPALGLPRGTEIDIIATDDREQQAALSFSEDGDLAVIIPDRFSPAFASYCIWHELAHARQFLLDYDGDQVSFFDHYWWLQEDPWWGEEGIENDSYAWHYSPWEADAHWTAREHRRDRLTHPGPHRPDLPVTWYKGGERGMKLDWKLIETVAMDYREAVGR